MTKISSADALARAALLLAACALPILVSCMAPPRPTVMPNASALEERKLQLSMICTDSIGNAPGKGQPVCLPCHLPNATANQALQHARRLEAHIASSASRGARDSECIRMAYQQAVESGEGGMPVRAELAVFNVFSLSAGHRALAIGTVDASLDTLLLLGDSVSAAQVLDVFARGVWDRAQRLLARSLTVDIAPEERSVHDIAAHVGTLKHVPPIPSPSDTLGHSEADWARALFLKAASLVPKREAQRTRYTRLALATLVVREQWKALDSAATVVLQQYPRDSVAPLARALARFRLVQHPVYDYPSAMALFDSALRALPRVDSSRYDDFDEVLSLAEDHWRNDFLAGERTRIDRRAWALFDPLWLTPVNEVHLVRRARMAEADFRYAHLAPPAKSGSETSIGVVLLRRGVPNPRWRTTAARDGIEYSWAGGFRTIIMARDGDVPWWIFYNDYLLPQNRIMLPLATGRDCGEFMQRSLFQCARFSHASLHDVPFENRQDTVDVTAARFRSSNDSVDLYIGARFPARRFPYSGIPNVRDTDSITYGVMIKTPVGATLFEQVSRRSLPPVADRAWNDEWRARVPISDMMHRVEALEPRSMAAARGTRQLTSTGASTFMTSGFGMSEILVAQSIRDPGAPARRWRDLVTIPNGAVIPPGGDVVMAWEIYGLTRGANGRSRWQVSLSREDGKELVNMELRALIIGNPEAGVKVVSAEPDASLISFQRNEPSTPVMVEHIKFRMPDVPPGRHVLRVRIQDLETDRIVQRSVSIRVLEPREQRR